MKAELEEKKYTWNHIEKAYICGLLNIKDLTVEELQEALNHNARPDLTLLRTWFDEEVPEPIQRAVVIRVVAPNKSILLLKRFTQDRTMPGWCLPGGKVEENETLEEAISRELMEETGKVAINIIRIGSYMSSIKGKDCEVTVFEMKIPYVGTVSISAEHEDYNWYAPQAIRILQKTNQLAGKTFHAITLKSGENEF